MSKHYNDQLGTLPGVEGKDYVVSAGYAVYRVSVRVRRFPWLSWPKKKRIVRTAWKLHDPSVTSVADWSDTGKVTWDE